MLCCRRAGGSRRPPKVRPVPTPSLWVAGDPLLVAEERLPARAASAPRPCWESLAITVLAEAVARTNTLGAASTYRCRRGLEDLAETSRAGHPYGLFVCEAAWALWQRSAIPKSRAHPWSLSKQRAAELRISKSTASARSSMADVIDVDEAEATDISTPVLAEQALRGRVSDF